MRLTGLPFREFQSVPINNIAASLDGVDWKSYMRHDYEQFGGSSSVELPFLISNKKMLGAPHLLDPVMSLIELLPDNQTSYVVRAYFGYVPPNGFIGMHPDIYVYHSVSHRYHVPIQTETALMIWEGEQSIHLKQGVLYEIDNIRIHGVMNPSDKPRIHLIIDMCPEKEYDKYRSVFTKKSSDVF